MGDKKAIAKISDPKVLAEQLVEDVLKLKNDIELLRRLSPEDRRSVLKTFLNKLIDIPMMPEAIEAMLIGFVLSYAEHIVNTRILSGKKDGT